MGEVSLGTCSRVISKHMEAQGISEISWFKGKGGNEGKFMIHDRDSRDSAAISVPQYFMLPNENI